MKRVAPLVVAMTCLLAACGGSNAPAPRTRAHKLRTSRATVTLTFPARWEIVEAGRTGLRLREGTASCTYTVTAAIDVVAVDAASATDAARSLVPSGDGRLLEAGRRGSAAWRVVKLHGNGTQVRLDAVRAQPLRFISAQEGRPTWLATRLKAASDPGDECHSGTYRDTLGPYLGDALATLRART